MAGIGLTDYIKPKNDAFTGMVQASQVLGGGGDGTLPDACVAEANVTQHEAAIDHDALANFAANEHFTEASIDHTAIANIGTTSHADIDTHIADTTDPHGTTMTVSTKVITPKIERAGNLFLDANDSFGNSTVFVRNTDGTFDANLNVDGNIIVGGTVDGRDIAADGAVLDTAALLPGQAGGQTLKGGTAASEDLALESTAHATKGQVVSADNHKFTKGASYDTLHDKGNVSGAVTIDWGADGNVQKMTLTGNVTSVAFTNPPGPCNCRLWIHAGTGGFTVAGWDADVDWGGSAPVVSAGANKFDVGVFEYDGGSIYAAQLAQGIDGTGFG